MKAKFPVSFRRLFILAGILPAITAFAQNAETEKLPDYVLSATRTPAALTTTGSYVDTISAAELERMQLSNLQSALGGIPGAPAFSSGARGAIASLFLRGSNSNQTLFLADGIRLNDPNTDYQLFLGGACVTGCDSLEIAHGPQSTLYGGEAMGGVISLNAQKGSGPVRSVVSVEAGSFGTVQGTLSSQGSEGQSAYNFSAAGGITQNDRPNNDFNSATYALRLDHKFSDGVAIGGTYRGFIGKYGSPGDRFTNDPDDSEKESNQLATVFANFTPTAAFNSRVVLGGQDRRFESISPGISTTLVKNNRVVLDWQNTLQFGEQHKVTAGLTAEENHTINTGFGHIDKRQQLLAFFVQDEWTPVDHVYLTAGLRSDDFDTFGRATTGRVTAAWLSKDSRWKVRGSYGTAFRAPSFLDLYGKESYYVGSYYDNPPRILAPEKAKGWDAGVDYFLPNNRGILSATWFDTRFRNLIVYNFDVFPGTTENVEKARTKGLELAGKFTLPGAIDVRIAYTYLEADNLSQNIRLLRRPRNSGSIDVWHDLGNAFSLGVGVAFVADRRDVDAATFAPIEGEDYTVARVYAAWKATSRITVKARIENLLNEKYEEVNGYPQPGFGAFGGIEYRF